MTDTTPQRNVLGTALRRFGAIGLLVGILAGYGAAQFVERVSQTTYTAEGSFVVPLAAPVLPDAVVTVVDPRPTSAYDAERLARNYAALISQDQALLTALEAPLGMPVDDLVDSIASVSLPSTAVIRVTFTAEEEATVLQYFASMRDLLAVQPSVTPNIPAGNLQPLRLPTDVIEQPGLAPVAPLVGALAGLLLGLAAAVLLERMTTQVRSAGDLRTLVPWPVLEVRGRISPQRYETFVLRVLDGRPDVRAVAVLSVSGISASARAGFTAELRRAEERLRASGRLPDSGSLVDWQSLGRVPDDGSVERAVLDAGAVVVAVARHARLRPATSALQRLADLGVRDVLVVLGAPRRQSDPSAPAEGSAGDDADPEPATATTGPQDAVAVGARAR